MLTWLVEIWSNFAANFWLAGKEKYLRRSLHTFKQCFFNFSLTPSNGGKGFVKIISASCPSNWLCRQPVSLKEALRFANFFMKRSLVAVSLLSLVGGEVSQDEEELAWLKWQAEKMSSTWDRLGLKCFLWRLGVLTVMQPWCSGEWMTITSSSLSLELGALVFCWRHGLFRFGVIGGLGVHLYWLGC